MADIVSLLGNPLKDKYAVHFPVDSGNPAYPTKPSNIIVKTDGAIEYGSVEDTVSAINKDVFTTYMKYKASDGTVVNGSNIARSFHWIPKESDIIKVDSTGYVTGIELLAWNSDDTYVGVWDAENESFVTTEKFYTEIKYKKVYTAYPSYKFKLSFTIDNSSISSKEARLHVLWIDTDYEITKDTVNDSQNVMLFDTNSITVIDGILLNGATGIVSADSAYVTTDFIDISKRINNVIEFNGTIKSNVIGFSIYDKGRQWIDGLWGSSPNLSNYGYIAGDGIQHITWTVPENAYYLRVCILKEFYSAKTDFNVKFLTVNQQNIADKEYDTSFISIAHKGYGGSSIADTLAAFISAGEAGFTAVEIDCRRTTDGIYVVSHNDTNTLYKNGSSQSVTISSSTWANMKGKCVDSSEKYPLCTLAQVFNTLKRYKVRYYIIDLKTGSNAEIMALARRCGVISQVMLSYYTQQSLLDDLEMIAKYPQISVRFTPELTPTAYNAVKAAIKNQLFADVNLSDGGVTYFPKALSMQLPILFSGIQESNKYVMAGLAAGAMAQTTLQYSPYDFAKMIDLNLNQFPTLTTETESVSISTSTNATVTVVSDIDDPACWIYGYSDDLSVCNVSQSSYGDEVTFTVSKVDAGTANLIVFTPTGEQLVIPVTAT